VSFYQNCHHYYHVYILATDYYIFAHLLSWSGRFIVPKFLDSCTFWIETHFLISFWCTKFNDANKWLCFQELIVIFKAAWRAFKIETHNFTQLSCVEINSAKSDSGHFDCMALVFLWFSMIQFFTCDFLSNMDGIWSLKIDWFSIIFICWIQVCKVI